MHASLGNPFGPGVRNTFGPQTGEYLWPWVGNAFGPRHMKRKFPSFHSTGIDADYVFHGTLQPREGLTEYSIRIEKRQAKYPKAPRVYIDYPTIVDGTPHIYPGDGSLCLYHGSEFRWSDDLYIADYIIPWTAAWLYFYEIWLECGIWYGEEYPHGENVRKKYDDEA